MKGQYVRYLLAGGMFAATVVVAHFMMPDMRPIYDSMRQERKVNAYIKEHGAKQLNYFLESDGVQQKNVCGDNGPESFIELGGVKYYSRIDGKDISDLVCK